MKNKTWIFAILLFMQFSSCSSQEAKGLKQAESKNKPHEEVSVNKEYDDDGNLIAFDSVYTSYYSNIDGDTLLRDSLLANFDDFFNNTFSKRPSWNQFYESDSTLGSWFYNDNFFEKQFVHQNQEMLQLMQEMDSLKNVFFNNHVHHAIP